MGDFFQTFKRDPLLGPAIHHKPWVRPKSQAGGPWEALCWAITSQLIESSARRRDPAAHRQPVGVRAHVPPDDPGRPGPPATRRLAA